MKLRYIFAAVLITGLFSVAFINSSLDALVDPAFNHSDCQYPTRTTNPVDGCDNSDPCDVEDAVSGGSGKCGRHDLPDPERSYYDAAGNLYDYRGNLISGHVQGVSTDEVGGK